MAAQCPNACNVFYPPYISNDRIPQPQNTEQEFDGQQALRHYRGQFFTFYKIMSPVACSVVKWAFFFFFYFFLHRAFKVFNEERPQHSHIMEDLIWSSCVVCYVFSSECHTKPKAHIQHTIHKQQR